MTPTSPMPTNPVFATPRLRGERFQQPEIPVEVLPALGIYRDLIFEIARSLVISRGGRQKAPPHFGKSFTLLLSRIDAGSAVPVLVKKFASSALDRDGWAEAFEDARDVVADTVGAINTDKPLPEEFPSHLLKNLSQMSALFAQGEELVLESPTNRKRTVATSLSDVTREKLKSRSAEPRESHRQFSAAVIGVDTENGRFKIRLERGNVVRGKVVRREFIDRLILALRGRDAVRAELDAMVFVDSIDTIVKIDELLSVKLWSCSSPEEVKRVDDRLASLDLLSATSSGSAAREFTWARDVLLGLMVDHGVPRPKIFTSPNGLRFEWRNGDLDLSVDLSLPARSAYLHTLNLTTDAEFEREYALGDLSTTSRADFTAKLKELLPLGARKAVAE